MKNLFLVTEFTIKEIVKKKSFIISTIILLIMIVVAFNIPNIIKAFGGDNLSEKVLVIDEENLFEGNIESLNQMDMGYEFELAKESLSDEQIKEKLADEKDSCIRFTKNGDTIKMEYIVESEAMNFDTVPQNLVSTFTSLYSNIQISKLNITPEQIAAIQPQFELEFVETEENAAQGNVFIMMIISLILFYAVFFCAQQVSASITTEKTSKIIETLVTSTDSKTIVLGKTLGIGIVGLVQVILMIVVALISAKFCMDPEILSEIFDLSSITPKLLVLTLVYFCFGYALYSLFFALTGATVSKPEDVQYANGPVSIIAIIGFYLAYFSMMNPNSGLNKISGIVPISSPFSMPLRVMMGTATTGEIAISLAVLMATTIVIAIVAIKVYSATILNTGARLSLKDAFKMAKDDK